MINFFKKLLGIEKKYSHISPEMLEILQTHARNSANNPAETPKPKSQPTKLDFLYSNYQLNESWIDLFTHFLILDVYNKMPSKEWYAELEDQINIVGKDDFLKFGSKWMDDCIKKGREKKEKFKKLGAVAAHEAIEQDLGFRQRQLPDWIKKVYGDNINKGGFIKLQEYAYLNNFQNYFYQSLGGRILRGFMHSAIILKDVRLIELVDKIALTSPNTSQDAIHIYSKLDKEISVPKLTYLKSKVKNKNVIKRINKAILEIGKREGLSKEEIEETVIPDYNITSDGIFKVIVDGISLVFDVDNIKNNKTYYILENDKTQKTVPKHLRDNFPQQVKEFKRICKEIKASLSSQKRRIEEFYLLRRTIPFPSFVENYLNNNLVKILAKDLIWNFQSPNIKVDLIFNGETFVNVDGEPFSGDLKDCELSLWHPMGFKSQEVLAWRQFILEREVIQPFKQAFREVYIITEAEIETKTYSNRFAGHFLKKDHVAALSKARGWSPSAINNYGMIKYKIPGSDYKVEYWASDVYLGERSSTYGSAHLATDQVRFYKKKVQLELTDVPAIIFSEVMRDIDLFVGVTSIGNDPQWHDRGDANAQAYWSSYSDGQLSKRSESRADILKTIVPKMKIAKVCEFEGRYLKVQGKVRKYKIHMGSGNILMEPNDQYLCIVPDRTVAALKKVFIPFEGDNMLSIIISKAILLANDDKTKDETILRQINTK